MSDATYSFRPGSRVVGVSPAAAGAELERIRLARGVLTRAGVVEEATPPGSVLHPAIFHLSDTEAAHQYRLDLAGHLIRAVYVRSDPDRPSLPAYVNVQFDDGSSYDRMDQVVRVPDRYAAAEAAMLASIRAAQGSLEELQEAASRVGNRRAQRKAKRVKGHIDKAAAAAAAAV